MLTNKQSNKQTAITPLTEVTVSYRHIVSVYRADRLLLLSVLV